MIWSAQNLSNCLNIAIHPNIWGRQIQFNSNDVLEGDIFIALKGNGDGHDYVLDAIAKGANAVIISREIPGLDTNKVIMVADTLLALTKMAEYKRQKSQATFIAVTGSSGKTGTKEAINTILSCFSPVFASRGNFNNYLGVLINLASMPDNIEYAIFELGMNHVGEIRKLTKMVKPSIAVITTISEAHIEFFNSSAEIADAKCEIFEGMEKSGIAVINIDNKYYHRVLDNLQKLAIKNIFTFGKSLSAKSRLVLYQNQGQNVHLQYEVSNNILAQNLDIVMPLIPEHYAVNYAAVLQVASLLNKDLEVAVKQLTKISPIEGRGKMVKAEYNNLNFDIICDYYNANPESLKASLLYFKQLSHKQKIAIVGDMLELGTNSVKLHQEIAPLIIDSGAKLVLLVGNYVRYIYDLLPHHIEKHHFDNVDTLINNIQEVLSGNELILIKGSKSIKLYKILQIFKVL
ncbi:UDP-N-acetylmuramoyl-tripeptide--D-alanyl-D-alanine ligase [Candidatus Tisiphia endosymbiont of Nemotelus uliginosus]|uniref:UDP-N-acetylmuramoyl-tripeptide--D-alanyl-D- alanine ligase n=1 Tax=Candidatus Tisiphia endosymbiont of Nemotelus uliginosus TaxID=3077926 RepID=UPI0035C90241